MTQDSNNPKHFIANEGKVFQRVYNGFSAIDEPYIVGNELILGEILVDAEGKNLSTVIDDDIHYYEEIDTPKQEESTVRKTKI